MSTLPTIPWTERERAEFKRRIVALEAGGGGGGGVSDGDKGDIVVSGGGTTWLVKSGAVSAAEIAGLAENIDDRVAALLVAGANVTLTYDDGSNTLTIAASGGGGAADSFETVNKNLSAADATFSYSGGQIDSIAYVNGITKTFTYGPDGPTTIVLSGSTPGGIDLTKTLAYSAGQLSSFTYS